MTNPKNSTLADLLPPQDHYYLLSDGSKYARHGTNDANGLLVFANLGRAEQFCMTVVSRTKLTFTPVRVPVSELLGLVEDIGSVCVTEGLTAVRVGKIERQKG